MASKDPKIGGKAANPSAAKRAPAPRSAIEVAPAAPVHQPEAFVADVPLAVPAVAAAAAELPPHITESAAAVTTPAVEATADTAQKETETMATNFESTTANTQTAMLGDMGERAKSAMAKSGKIVEEMNDFAKGNIEAMVESSRITAKGLESMGQDAAEYGRKSFESLTATLRTLATVKSPTEFMKLNSDFVRSSFDQAVAEASRSTEAMIKLAGDAAQPISSRFAVAAEKVKTAA